MMNTSALYINNKYQFSNIEENSVLEKIKDSLLSMFKNFLKINPPDASFKIYSNGRRKKEYSMYTGTGGNIYVYWKYHLMNKNIAYSKHKTIDYMIEAFNTNYKIVINEENSKGFNINEQSTSFFNGPVGIYTMGCILANEISDESLFLENIKKIHKYKKLALSEYSEDELLYGNSGYLYSLSLVYKLCIKEGMFKNHVSDLEKDIVDVILFLFEIGSKKKKEKNNNYMLFPFPRNESDRRSSKFYLGGAHGIFGILYEMLTAIKLLGDKFDESLANVKTEIEKDLVELSKLQFDSGNFPSSLHKSSDELVQFCHGATGAVFIYGLAHTYFKKDLFLKVAIKCGNAIWDRGLLKKGNGVCHGIIGNAYALYYLNKITGDSEWLKKAHCFILASMDEEIQNICYNYDHSQRVSKGVPDTPYSLMEGEGGTICLYSDILNGLEFVKFPGYEI